MTNFVKDRPVTAHVFEYTTSFALDADLQFKYPDKGIVPCQIIFCMKEKNVSRSHLKRGKGRSDVAGQKDQFASLVLQCLCASPLCERPDEVEALDLTSKPNVCVLLDVGTRPAVKSLYYLWKAFDLNSKVGGACGEIATFKGRTWRSLLNPLGQGSLI